MKHDKDGTESSFGNGASHECDECGATFLTERALNGHEATCPDHPLVTDGGSKYVRETGDGYVGVHTLSAGSIRISMTTAPVDWAVGTEVYSRRSDAGVVLQPTHPDDPLGAHGVNRDATGSLTGCPSLYVAASALAPLDVEEGDDIRVYDHADGLELVAAAEDPKLVADGGQLEVCPECEYADFYARFPGKPASRSKTQYRCGQCGAEFDEPELSDRSTDDGRRGLSRDLLEADPDDLATDGGHDELPSFCAVDEHGGPTVMFDGGQTCSCGKPLETQSERETGYCSDCDFTRVRSLSTDRSGGTGLDSETFVDVDDALEIAQEQAEDARVRYHIKQARSIQQAQEVIDD